MYKLIKEKIIIDDNKKTVNRYLCTFCNSEFLALDTNVVCDCQKPISPLVPKKTTRKPNIYFALIHESNGRVYCVVKEKNKTATKIKDRFKIVVGEFPSDSAPHVLQLIASSSSSPALTEWLEKVREDQPKDYKDKGKRLSPEERDRLKEQILILHSQGVSQREMSRLLGIDRKTITKIIVI